MTIEIVSFGYGHAPAPDAHITLDLRTHFRDPHVSPELRDLTAEDTAVQVAVAGTPGIWPLVEATVAELRAFLAGPTAAPVRVAIGCVGGRHRSAVVAQLVTNMLASDRIAATLEHRDLHRPVINRGGA